VAVQKAVELTGTGGSIEDAIGEAIDRAGLTLEGITGFEVQRLAGVLDGARISYEVQLRVWFILRERMHG
jgi:flavin-binding protein dodecin